MACNIYVTEYTKHIISQYKSSPKIKAIIDGFLDIIQQKQVATLCTLENDGIAIDKASGYLLDTIGENYGYPRPSIESNIATDDEIYRKLIKLWTSNIYFGGTTLEVNAALTNAFGKGYLIDFNDMTAGELLG